MGVSIVTFNGLCLTLCLYGDNCCIQTPGKAVKLVYVCDVGFRHTQTPPPQCIPIPVYMCISVPKG